MNQRQRNCSKNHIYKQNSKNYLYKIDWLVGSQNMFAFYMKPQWNETYLEN